MKTTEKTEEQGWIRFPAQTSSWVRPKLQVELEVRKLWRTKNEAHVSRRMKSRRTEWKMTRRTGEHKKSMQHKKGTKISFPTI